jgi:predicted  nucleic acid-binding Zn-ribbon protein
MSFDDNILLKLRREFSGNEKYRLFLQQLDRLENELREENKLILKLRQENQELAEKNNEYKRLNGELRKQNEQMTCELKEWNATEAGKKFVSIKAYNKLQGSAAEWIQRYWELHGELQKLKAEQHTGDESL